MDIAAIVLEYLKALIWPVVAVVLAVMFKGDLRLLLARIRHAKLPGGVSLDLPEEIAEAKTLSERVAATPTPAPQQRGPAIPLTEANARLLALGLRPSPSGLDMGYYRSLVAQDPNLALAGLRIEIDVLARNLAKGSSVEISERDTGARLLRKLHDQGAITPDQMLLTMKVLELCNAAIHGTPISRENAEDVIHIAAVLAEQFLAWLRGFPEGWTPAHADPQGVSGASD